VSAESDALSLIPLIYDAAENPAVWPDALNKIGQRLKAVGKVIAIDDLHEGRSNMAVVAGIDPLYQRLYDERYESINIHIRRARPLLVPGRVIATHQFCSDDETLASEYYNDFLRPQKDWFYVVGGCVARDRSLMSVINFIRGRKSGRFSDREIRLLESLMPHLRRAARLHQMCARHQDVAACLEILPVGALLVSNRGFVQFANRAAHAIFQVNDGISIDGGGYLTSIDRRLREIIAAACQAAEGNGAVAGGSLLVGRNSGKRPYAVSASPIRRANLFAADQRPGAVVFINDPETRLEPIAGALQRLYGMTPTEARLASLLAEGKDLSEACAEMSIRRTTARTHLARLSQKLGVRRQAEAVSVILRTVAVLDSGAHHPFA
jgi:DNA-binding CsgD family transcriptional regulator/PAS domain-containing protein